MRSETILRTLSILTALGFVALMPAQANAQCAVAYGDVSADGVNVYAWNSLMDYYDLQECNNGATGFTHYYYVQATIESPSHRQSEGGYNASSAYGGGGYTEAFSSLDISGEYGEYIGTTYHRLDCTGWGGCFAGCGPPVDTPVPVYYAQIDGFDDEEDSEEATFNVTVGGGSSMSGSLLILALRMGQSAVVIYSGSHPPGTYTIPYLAQGYSLPTGTYTGLIPLFRGSQGPQFTYPMYHDGCNDGRSDLIVEYFVRSYPYIPGCTDLKYQPASSGSTFGWSVIQSHGHQAKHEDHALFRDSIDNGIEQLNSHHSGGITISTANRIYRCPSWNASPSVGGNGNSRHIWGDAADVHASSLTVEDQIRTSAFNHFTSNKPCVSPRDFYDDHHFHMDFRTLSGAFVQAANCGSWTLALP